MAYSITHHFQLPINLRGAEILNKPHKMKLLPTKFTKNGFTHEKLQRVGDLAIYRRWKGNTAPHFEVIEIARHNGFTVRDATGKETDIPAAETYPSSEQWGSKGFTYPDEASATKRFKAMLRK